MWRETAQSSRGEKTLPAASAWLQLAVTSGNFRPIVALLKLEALFRYVSNIYQELEPSSNNSREMAYFSLDFPRSGELQ